MKNGDWDRRKTTTTENMNTQQGRKNARTNTREAVRISRVGIKIAQNKGKLKAYTVRVKIGQENKSEKSTHRANRKNENCIKVWRRKRGLKIERTERPPLIMHLPPNNIE